ncbi:MAG TPA: GxxExxY protein [Gemmatimonadaceae bacterium]
MNAKLIEADRVSSIIGGFYDVYRYFGFGFVESVYSGALALELADRGHTIATELAVDIRYKDRHVVWQRLDLVVDERIVVEVKSGERLPPYASRQLVNYLHATTFQVGLLLHFGPEPKFYRYVETRKRAPVLTRQSHTS